MTYEADLITARNGLAAFLAAQCIAPSPNYQIENQRVDFATMVKIYTQQIGALDQMIREADTPVDEVLTEGYVEGSPSDGMA